MRVVLDEESVLFYLVNIDSTQTVLTAGEQVADQVDTARTHNNVVWEGQGLLVVHNVGVGSYQGLREKGTFSHLGKQLLLQV